MNVDTTIAREQIRMGEALARETGASHNEAVDACHFLIPDGGAARQGNDPGWLLTIPKLAHLYSRAIEIERLTVVAWTETETRDVLAELRALGHSRLADANRLAAYRVSR